MILADLYKIRKSMWIKILLIITILCAVSMTIIAGEIEKGNLDINMAGIGFLLSDANMISLLGAVIAGIFICGDFDNKTIHDAISGGNSRVSIIVSKTIVFIGAIACILLPYAILTGIALNTGNKYNMGNNSIGFLHLITSEGGKDFDASAVLGLLTSMATLVIVHAAQQSISILFAFLIKKPVIVIAVSYAISVINPRLTVLRANSEVFDKICSFTPFGGDYTFITSGTEADYVIKALAVSLIFIVLIIGITYATFRKKEVK